MINFFTVAGSRAASSKSTRSHASAAGSRIGSAAPGGSRAPSATGSKAGSRAPSAVPSELFLSKLLQTYLSTQTPNITKITLSLY